jgi:hypothetical protein
MKHLYFIAMLLFMLPSVALAQKRSCNVYFTVIQSDPHLPGGNIAALSKKQEEWWIKKGAKKYSTVCYDPAKATYKIVWWREVVGDNEVIKNTSDPRYDVSVRGTRDIGYAFVKQIDAPEVEKPLFFIDRDRGGTADVLEKAVKYLAQISGGLGR